MIRIILFLFVIYATVNAQTLTFGVFTYRTPEKIMKEYEPIAQYISQELNMKVIIKPLSQEALEEEVKAGNIDIISTNPTHYLSLLKQGKTTGAIATLVKRYGTVGTPYLGGVIIALSKREEIRFVADLKGKTVAIANKNMLGGYQTQHYELFKSGIDIKKDVKIQTYETHTAVVDAILSKKADAGFIRSGIIEEMVAKDNLNLEELFIINEQKSPHFPLKISTTLYPEWSIVASKELDTDTISKIAVALYGYKNMQMGHDIISGFTIPGDYANIDSLARTLRIPPYDYIPHFTHEDIWNQHKDDIITLLAIVILFFILFWFLYRRTKFEKKYVQSILNATPTPVIVTNGKSLISANSAFLNYVNFESLEKFKDKHDCICDFFEEGNTDEYLSAYINDKTWTEYIIENPQSEHKVQITINNITNYFKVDVSVVKYKDILRNIVIFNDISQLVNQSVTDALTRIANRTHFNLLFEHSFSISRREKTPLSLIFFDIDHFKAVNDTYGHLVGDDVLRHLATLVKNSLRKSDVIARWGGEEFIILLPNTSICSATHIAEELRKTIESEKFAVIEELTCSFGVAQLEDKEEADELLLRLDELLYIAKKGGRNRVEVG